MTASRLLLVRRLTIASRGDAAGASDGRWAGRWSGWGGRRWRRRGRGGRSRRFVRAAARFVGVRVGVDIGVRIFVVVVVFLERNFQQEANLHNLLKDVLDTRFMVMIVALGCGVVGPFLSYLALLPRQLTPSRALLPYFASVAWLELSYPYELVGELAELLLGLLFLTDVAARLGRDPLASARGSVAARSTARTPRTAS